MKHGHHVAHYWENGGWVNSMSLNGFKSWKFKSVKDIILEMVERWLSLSLFGVCVSVYVCVWWRLTTFDYLLIQVRWTRRSAWLGRGSASRRSLAWTWVPPSAWTPRNCSTMKTWTATVLPRVPPRCPRTQPPPSPTGPLGWRVPPG